MDAIYSRRKRVKEERGDILKKFPNIVAIITLVLIGLSIICTFVGAFVPGKLGTGLLMLGIFGFVAFAIVGWAMIAVYKYIHKDDYIEDDVPQEQNNEE